MTVVSLDERRPRAENQMWEDRLKASAGKEHIVTVPEGAGIDQIAEYFGISRSGVLSITKRYGTELREVGYIPGFGQMKSSFSRRAVLHVAMLLRPNTSDVAKKLRMKMGVWVDHKPTAEDLSHRGSCKGAIDKAIETIANVRDIDPHDMWTDLNRLDRWQIQAVAVALATMVPDDLTISQLQHYLTDMSKHYRWETGDNPAAAHGLTKLTPQRPARGGRKKATQ